MIEKTCRCKKSKKNFRIDIGPFFIGECCVEAGYDELGNKKGTDPNIEAALQEITDIGQEIELEIEQEEAKKKRPYNRNGKIKIKKDT